MKTFVNFLRQGLPTVERPVEVEETREVSSRDTSKLQVPADVFGFYFFDVGESGRENVSSMHYIKGEVSTKKGERVLVVTGGTVISIFKLKPDDVLLTV